MEQKISLKFFFNRHGKVVKGLLFFGWFGALWTVWAGPSFLYLLFCSFCLIIAVTRFIPWYPASDRGAGIEEHFQKTMVPLAYMMVLTNFVYWIWPACWPLLVLDLVGLGLIVAVNAILIYFYFRDKDPTPPSFFSRNLHLD